MNTLNLARQTSDRATPRAATLVFRLLNSMKAGHLCIRLPSGETLYFGQANSEHLRADIQLHNWKLFSAVLKSGDIGFAESYIREDWSTDSLIDVLNLLVANREDLEKAVYGTWLGRLGYRIKHLLNRNGKANAKKNIHAHYDIGNSFYQLWLDKSMTYSSALFDGDFSKSTEAAQLAKYERALGEINAKPGNHLLEIGCGWGGFAERAKLAELNLKGLTLSTEQLEFATQRLAHSAAGKDTQQTFALQDYRDEKGLFDGIVSIEMFEAVGQEFWPSYFETLKRCLKSQAKACVQTITISDALFERYKLSTDFIQQYIFPGGMLPSEPIFEALAEKHGLTVVNKKSFGLDYAQTLARWRKTFMAQLTEVRALGFDTPFIKTWEFYLAYCEAAFNHHNTSVVQYTLQKK